MKPFLFMVRLYAGLAGGRLLLQVSVMLLCVGLDGIGVTMLLPLLEGMDSESQSGRLFKPILGFFGMTYELKNLLLLLFIVVVLRSLFLVLQDYYTGYLRTKMQCELRWRLSRLLFGLDFERYTRLPSGYLNNAIVRETGGVLSGFLMLSRVCVQVLFVMVYALIPLFFNWSLVVVMACSSIPLLFLTRWMTRVTRQISVRYSEQHGTLQQCLIQAIRNFKYLKATQVVDTVDQHIQDETEALARTDRRNVLLSSVNNNLHEPLVALTLCAYVYYYVGVKGGLLMSVLFSLFLLMRALRSVTALQGNYRKLMNCWGSISTVTSLLEELGEGQEPGEGTTEAVRLADHDIVFDHVDFVYQASADPVLEDIRLTIPARSTVAFVGESGTGKSTLLNLLVGLLRPTAGCIRVGGCDYERISRQAIRKQVGYITQEVVIFRDTVLKNVTLWNTKDRADPLADAQAACRQAHIHEFIMGLENGYETLVGEGGIDLSGGQRQRICIARELYKNADLLVFDEATSALDTKTEKEIQRNIQELHGQKTIVLVAHRFSTVRDADKIIFLEHGKVTGEGTYEELMERSGSFRELAGGRQA